MNRRSFLRRIGSIALAMSMLTEPLVIRAARPSTEYEEFLRLILADVARGAGIPFELLAQLAA